MPLYLQLLGQPYAETQRERYTLRSTKPTYVLLYLAYRGDWVSRDTLAELICPDADDATARHNLRLQLTRARKLPWAGALTAEAKRLRLLADTDVAAFREALGRGDSAAALSHYRGPFLAGIPGSGVATVDAWVELERERLHSTWREVAFAEAKRLEHAKRYDEALKLLKQLLQDDSLAEDIAQALMRVSYLVGKRRAALDVFEQLKAQLASELGLEPLVATSELASQIREAAPLVSGAVAAPTPRTPQLPLTVLRPPRLIGRDKEYTRVKQAITPVVTVAGEPGIGKTRLLQEALTDARWLYCREGLEQLPYLPLLPYLRTLDKALLQEHQVTLAALMPECAPASRDAPELDPAAAKARFLQTLALLLERASTPLVVDDLQWADAATLEFLGLLITRGTCQLYLAYRIGELSTSAQKLLSRWQEAGDLTEVHLKVLSAETMTHLVTSLQRTSSAAPRFGRWLFECSGGNPFYALETLKGLFEADRLRQHEGIWASDLNRLTYDDDDLVISESVAAAIQRRVSRLSETTQRVLEATSIMGEVVTTKRLVAVTGLSPWAVVDALAEAEARGLMNKLAFAHDIIRQSLYRAIPEPRRQLWHSHIADALVGEVDALVLAEHHYAADELEAAAELWFATASERFDTEAGFAEQATALYERIVALGIRSVAVERARAYLAARVLNQGQFDEAEALVRSVLAESTDAVARAFALLVHCQLEILAGNVAAAAKCVAEAADHAARTEEPGLKRDVVHTQAMVANKAGNFETALVLLAPLTEQYRQRPPSFGYANHLLHLANNHASLGRYQQALSSYKEVLRVAQALGHATLQALAYTEICSAYQDLGEFDQIVPYARACLALGEFDFSNTTRYALADAYRVQGRTTEAEALAAHILIHEPAVNLRAHVLAMLCEMAHQGKQHARVDDLLEQAFDLVADTDRTSAVAVVTLAALRTGSTLQQQRARKWLESLALEALPSYLRDPLQAWLERSQTS